MWKNGGEMVKAIEVFGNSIKEANRAVTEGPISYMGKNSVTER